MDDTQVMEPENGYPPDADGGGQDFPQPRAKKARAVLQANKPQPRGGKTKKVKRGSSRILVQQKRRQALEFRKAGMTYAQIADQVGYSDAAAARKAVLKGMDEVIQEPATELKAIQVERLNHMLLTIWGKVSAGDEVAQGMALRIMDKLDRLLGTEEASRIEVNQKSQSAVLVIDGNKDDYITALKRMSGAGIGPDGKNITTPSALPPGAAVAQGAVPAGVGGKAYPPGMGAVQVSVPMNEMTQEEADDDVVDAVLVEDETREAGHADAGTLGDDSVGAGSPSGDAPVADAVPTRKSYSFGTQPKVAPRPRERRG